MTKASVIRDVRVRRIFDSRGMPTIEVEIYTLKGYGIFSAPSGASTGANEARPYPKEGIERSIEIVKKKITPILLGMDADEQEKIDSMLHHIDGSKNFEQLGGNASIAISLAIAKASASSHGIPLFKKIIGGNQIKLPHPLGNVLGGGKHVLGKAPDIQEFLTIPKIMNSFVEGFMANIRVHSQIKDLIDKKDSNFTGGKGDEGAWAPNLSNEDSLDVVSETCKKVSDEFGTKISMGIDIAATSLWDKASGKYIYKRDKIKKDRGQQIDYVLELIKKYHLVYVEDPLHEEDFNGFSEITKKSRSCLICGDDLFTTNSERLKLGIQLNAGNSIIIKPNQIGTLTDTIKTVDLAKMSNYLTIMSHRSGETCDPYLAHLAIGLRCPVIKSGVIGGERTAKLNELIRIEELLGNKDIIEKLNIGE